MTRGVADRRRVRAVARAAAAFVALAVVAAYGRRGPLDLPALGEAAGVLAVVYIVASLLLMLRLPALAERCGGLEQMYALHRGFGLAGYGLALLHPLLLAAHDGWPALSLAGKDIGFRSGWTAALVLMVVLFCTFALKTRGYAIWRRLHTLSLVALVALAWHVAANQGDLPAAARGALYALLAVGLAVPVARHLLVDRGLLAAPFRVEAVGHPTPDVVEVQLRPSGAALAIEPGQFVFARFLAGADGAGCAHFHPFTASAVDHDGGLRLSIKANGPCTRAFQAIRPGAAALLQGPYGELFQHARRDDQVWIAGGIGITPFLARVRALRPGGGTVRLFYFFDDPARAPYRDELEALAGGRPGLSLHCVSTRGDPSVAASIFDALLPPWDDKHYVLCGPAGFTAAMRAYLAAHRVAPAAISEERFEFR